MWIRRGQKHSVCSTYWRLEFRRKHTLASTSRNACSYLRDSASDSRTTCGFLWECVEAFLLSGKIVKDLKLAKTLFTGCPFQSALVVVSAFHWLWAILYRKLWKSNNNANGSCPQECKWIVSGGMQLILNPFCIYLWFISTFLLPACICMVLGILL